MTKQALRKIYKEKRLNISSKDKLKYDDLMLIQFQQFDFGNAESLLTYWPMAHSNEPNTQLFTAYLRHSIPNLQIAYPVVDAITETMNAILINEKIIEIDKENADAYYHLAGLYNIQKDSNKALPFALKAIEIFDQSWNYYFHLSLIYSNLSNFEESINALKKAIDLKPDYFEAYCNMADAYNHLGKFDLAIEFATKAVDINPEDIYSICTLAEAYEHKKELNIAKRLFEKVLKIDSTFQYAIEGLQRIEANIK